MPITTPEDYSMVYHDCIGDLFIDVVRESDPSVADVLRHKRAICTHAGQRFLHSRDEGSAPAVAGHNSVMDAEVPHAIEGMLKSVARLPTADVSASILPTEQAVRLAELDAKLVDVQRRARKTASITVSAAVASISRVRMGDTFNELVERYCRANLPREQVAEALQYAFTWPSLTTHPTNPLSFQYTEVATRLDAAIANPNTSEAGMKALLRRIRDTPMHEDVVSGGADATTLVEKKTPELEVQELLLFLDVIYTALVRPQRRLREALDRFGYHDVACPATVCAPCVWGAGDGDGNPNMTQQSLEFQLRMFRRRVCARYIDDLESDKVLNEVFAQDAADGRAEAARGQLVGLLHEAMSALNDNGSGAVCESHDAAERVNAIRELINRMKHYINSCGAGDTAGRAATSDVDKIARQTALDHLDDFLVRLETCGLHFARTDVRHNSVDIMDAIAGILDTFGALPAKRNSDTEKNVATASPTASCVDIFLRSSEAEQAALFRDLLNNDELVSAITRLSDAELKAKLLANGRPEVVARVFMRMRVVARHPMAFEKLIIAETRTAAQALAALLLLRLAGGVVAARGATVSIVPLFESREDLAAAPRTFHTLATDPVFKAHLEHTGRFIAMIAKSDTTRLSGAGVIGRQEDTVAELMAMNRSSYGKFAMHIFVGGGDDQMRGGGRIVETAHVLSLAARRMEAKYPARFAMTIQGMQMQLIFGAPNLAEHFIEAFASQQSLAAARLSGFLTYRPTPQLVNRSAAIAEVKVFFNDAMDWYERLVGDPKAPEGSVARRRRDTVVDYFSHFPASIITSGNKSSRPMARKKTNDPLQGRAISLDQLSKHDGAYITATLGVNLALQRFNATTMFFGSPEPGIEGPMRPVRHCYLANKTFRDFVRMQAVVLAQKDYVTAWKYRGGPPATLEERERLVAEYLACSEIGSGADAQGPRTRPASARALLAFAEQQDHEEAAILMEAITGRRPSSVVSQSPAVGMVVASLVDLAAPLRAGWPSLAKTMAMRSRASSLGLVFERAAVEHVTAKEKQSAALPALLRRFGYFAYVGVNPQFSTPCFALTMTDPVKEATAHGAIASDAVVSQLRWPLWLASVPGGSKL